MDEHKHHLQLVVQHFKEYGIVINPSKCELRVTILTFLGHTLNSQGVCPLQEKVTAIQEFLLPNTKHKLKEFRSCEFLTPFYPTLCTCTPANQQPLGRHTFRQIASVG